MTELSILKCCAIKYKNEKKLKNFNYLKKKRKKRGKFSSKRINSWLCYDKEESSVEQKIVSKSIVYKKSNNINSKIRIKERKVIINKDLALTFITSSNKGLVPSLNKLQVRIRVASSHPNWVLTSPKQYKNNKHKLW